MSTHRRNPKTVAQKQRRDDAQRRRAHAARRRARIDQARRLAVIVLIVAAVGGGFIWLVLDSRPAGPPDGVIDTDELGRNHVAGDVDYDADPPAGGDHAPAWQNCGYYDQPVADENAVHSLEHGAVWIQFASDADDRTTARIRAIAEAEPFVLASPRDGLGSSVVASAWGKQLTLDSVDDPRLEQFLEVFVQGPQTPEPGAACTGGVGEPLT